LLDLDVSVALGSSAVGVVWVKQEFFHIASIVHFGNGSKGQSTSLVQAPSPCTLLCRMPHILDAEDEILTVIRSHAAAALE